MVQADKKSIYAVVGHRYVTDEELITVFTGLESLLNSRLLTYQSSDLRDDVSLTKWEAKWEENLPLSLLKPLFFIYVKRGERVRTL